MTTEYYTGSDCSGSDGGSSRVLTLANTSITSSTGFFVYASGLILTPGTEYGVSHTASGTQVTFINGLWDDINLIIVYRLVSDGPEVSVENEFAVGDVTYENLVSRPRLNVENLIKENVADPISVSTVFRKWVYSRVPDTKSTDFKGYPFIVVYPAGYDQEQGGSMNGKSKFVSWEIEIEIFTSDRGYGSKDGQGLTHIDSISNAILRILSNMTHRNSLSDSNMKFSRPRTTSVSTEVLENELVYRRSIISGFKNRIQVSA